jgi:penicillin amidase
MDLLRRRAQGELAAAFGEGALRADRDARTLGLGAAAAASLAAARPRLPRLLEAYAAGVNAYLASHRDALPLEFRMLRYEPRPWTAADTVAVGKLLALDLAQGWEAEAFRASVGDALPPEVQDLLFPSAFPTIGSCSARTPGRRSPPAATRPRAAATTGSSPAPTPPPASRCWPTAPHLGLTVPSIWTAGPPDDTGPGRCGGDAARRARRDPGPQPPCGLGCTNVHDDSADLYVEEFDGYDRYKVPGGWETAAIREERIEVRDGPLSRHDPHRRPSGAGDAPRPAGGDPRPPVCAALDIARRHAGADRVPQMDRASNWGGVPGGPAPLPGPLAELRLRGRGRPHRVVLGGPPAHPPIRRRRASLSRRHRRGRLDRVRPFEALPHLVDPPSGRIVTANNRLVGSDYPYVVTRGGIGPWRAAALFRALESREGWTADDMVRLQGERLSLPHLDLARALLDAAARHRGDPLWDEVAREMTGWDGRMQADSRAAALAMATFRSLGDRVIGPRVDRVDAAEALRRRSVAIHRLIRERPPAFIPSGDAAWDGALRGAWQDAVAELARALGTDRARWRWGR